MKKSALLQSNAQDAREPIDHAAYELFSRHGTKSIGIDAIIERSGVAKATLYRHYRSKEDLVIAFLRRRDKLWTQDWLLSELEGRSKTPVRASPRYLRRLRWLVPPARL